MAEQTIENERSDTMGMDVYGSNPDSKVGEYFRRGIWGWSALWGYCASVSPEAASLGDDAYSNGGHGLPAEDAKKLATTLRKQLASGAAKAAIKEIAELDVAPPVAPAAEFLMALSRTPEFAPLLFPPHEFSEQDVCEFAEFLEHSGGFKIC